MLQLQTRVNIPTPDFNIGYNDKIILLGSCFSTYIGNRLARLKFDILNNPFGVIYNPASISKSLDLLLGNKLFTESDLNFFNDLWFSFYHHSTFSSDSKQTCLKNINDLLNVGADKLKKASVIFITPGTSWIYRYKKTGEIVANCHKIPAAEFSREYLSPHDSYTIFSTILDKIITINPNIKFVFTISPIRHWKDGAIENMRSKASLILAIKELGEKYNNLYYFPVYELFMDEMRDYRFYAPDMIHPSDLAIDYVWEKFMATFFAKESLQQLTETDKFISMLEHRPLKTNTASYLKFTENLRNTLTKLQEKYPFIDFSNELNIVRERNFQS